MKRYAKAIVGGAAAFFGTLATALPNGVSSQEWVTILAATLGGLGIVYAVPNRPAVK